MLLGLLTSSALSCQPLGAASTTRVESGLLYASGHPEFDQYFTEYFDVQTALAKAAEDERRIRQTQSQKLGIVAGATQAVIVETVTGRAGELAKKKVLLRLKLEGLGAEDEADTMVQAEVSGTLDESSRQFVEQATLLARLELRHAAALRKLKKRLTRLAAQSQALEPSLEPTFGEKGYSKLDEVRRNLLASRRNLPLLTLRAGDQAEDTTTFVQKLRTALTTDEDAPAKTDAPLISPRDASQTKRGRPSPGSASPRKPGVAAPAKPKSEPGSEPGAGDFEP